jgi:hypothetical protein
MMVEHIPLAGVDSLTQTVFFLESFIHQPLSISLLASFSLSNHCGGGPLRTRQDMDWSGG